MQRHLPFDKAINFRDLGGYMTSDGRRVKWKRLFRCGHMAQLTDADMDRLSALGIAAICDFRSASEQEQNPSPVLRGLGTAVHRLEIWPKSGANIFDYARRLATGELTEASFHNIQKDIYREFVTDFSNQYATMFRLMDEAQGRPVVIHCTAGKDRTGVGAALILSALGVSEETIREDYLLSNSCTHLHGYVSRLVESGVAGADPTVSHDVKFERLMGALGADAALLQTACDAIRERAGSVDGYLRDVLGVTDEKRARMREWFLEG